MLAICVVTASLTSDISALQLSCLEAIFRSLLLCLSWQVAWRKQFINQCLVLANTIGEHASMITICIETPLYVHRVTSLVRDDGLRSPSRSGLVVIDRYTRVVAAWTAASNLSSIKIRPSGDRLEDSAFRASVSPRLTACQQGAAVLVNCVEHSSPEHLGLFGSWETKGSHVLGLQLLSRVLQVIGTAY